MTDPREKYNNHSEQPTKVKKKPKQNKQNCRMSHSAEFYATHDSVDRPAKFLFLKKFFECIKFKLQLKLPVKIV